MLDTLAMVKKPLKTLIVCFVIYFSLSFFLALAKPDTPPSKGNSEPAVARGAEKAAERQEIKEQQRLRRCELIANRARFRIAKMEENKLVHLKNYEKISERLSNIIVKMNELGLDTTDLVSDQEAFDEMVSIYMNTYSDFLLVIGNYEDGVCNESDDNHKTALDGAKGHLHTLIQQRKRIRSFYSSEIRLGIKALRDQVQDLKAEEEEVNNE